MELSSGSESPRSDNNDATENNHGRTKDDIQRGVDFIGFESSEDESNQDYEYTPRSKTIDVQKNNDTSSGSKGIKRTRRELSDDSDSDGPTTGPPPGCPWMGHRKYTRMKTVPMMLTQELKDFVDYISPTREEHQVRKYVAKRLEVVIRELWKDAKVVVFGSFETKLYLPTSDMDIVVIRKCNFVKQDLYKLAGHLRSRDAATDISVIAKAKVPIIKFKESISGIPVDISFNMTNGIQSATNQNEVYNGGLGSYTTVIMILSFLQMHPEVQMGRVNVGDNLGVFLIEFFELYGLRYSYSRVGLAVTNGGSYFDKVANGFGSNNMGRGGSTELLLTSIDPNDPDNDTARGSYTLKKIREVFVGAYGSLSRAVQQRQRQLFPVQDKIKGHIRFDNHNQVAADSTQKSSGLHKSEEVSLIRGVFSIPREIFIQRQQVENLFYSGAFQKLFGDPEGIRGLDQMEGKIEIDDQTIEGDEKTTDNNLDDDDKVISMAKSEKNPGPMNNRYLDLQYFIFKNLNYITDTTRDSKKTLKKEVQKVTEDFKRVKPTVDDTQELHRFAMSAVELICRATLCNILKLKTNEGKPPGRLDRENAFREAHKFITARFESASNQKCAVLVFQHILSESDILEAAKRLRPVSSPKALNKLDSGNPISKKSAASTSLQNVEFVPEDDSEDAEEGEYFDELIKQGEKEYRDSDDDNEEDYRSTSTGHINPNNVKVSGDSIQLPQLVSTSTSSRHNSTNGSLNGQSSRKNTPRTTPKGSPRDSPKNSPRG
ncbi:hypothetical protein BGZ76_010201 [Entomortierella beljakovae]|nr:hypothetical protein BGZ76_010201 [Entomortierella beljakovae]